MCDAPDAFPPAPLTAVPHLAGDGKSGPPPVSLKPLTILAAMAPIASHRRYFFPDESAPIRALQSPPSETPTVADRLARIERELDAIRREAA